MLGKRVKRLLQVSIVSRRQARYSFYDRPNRELKNPTADIRPRHPALLALEGWYDTEIAVPEQYQPLYNEYINSGSRVKFTRWALRNGELTETEASALGRELETIRFKLSCRHHDLLRLAETKHYYSCMVNSAGMQQLQYLADPDMAVAYVPDKAGKFSWRTLVRLVVEGDVDDPNHGYALVFYRTYGNGPTQAIYEALDKKIPVYQARDIRHYHIDRESTVVKVSPTIHNNKFLSRPVWTDHYGVGWDQNRRIRIEAIARAASIQYEKQEVRHAAF